MKILVYSDLHLHNHHGLLVNSETALNNLTFFKEYALENKIKKIINCGDFFHTKAKAYAPHVVQARLRLKDWYKSGLEHYMIIGNHDMSNQNNTMNSIIFVFNEYAKIIPDYFYEDINNTRLHFMSYTSKLFPHFILSEDKKNVLFTHIDIIGFTMSNGFKANVGFKKEDLKKFDLVISGHYHKHQEVGNIIYVGSTHQTSFGERDQKHGFMVFDTDTLTYDFIENISAPRYKLMQIKSYKEIEDISVDNCFLKVKLLTHRMSYSKLKTLLFEKGALSVDILPADDPKEIGKHYDKRLSDVPIEIASAYVNELKGIEHNKNKLIEYFLKIEEVANKIVDFELEEE